MPPPPSERNVAPQVMWLGAMRCVNAQPGTYGHECSKPAIWIGTTEKGFAACYCNSCKMATRRGRL
jgi:hypothetical protein